jgi:alkylation response protein AidB-like acyl-CoA dehydrogenase
VDFGDTPEEAALRAEARAWLEANFPAWRASVGNPERYTGEHRRAWHRKLFEGGWGAPSWPVEYGGKGFGPVEASIWADEKARIGASIPFNVTGFGMAGPTLIATGTDEQKERYVPPLLAGEEIWCQLFSEPGAGSDVAGLSTRAVREGDDWVLNGQKVWTSLAHVSKWGMLLARTNPEAPKHEGMSYFLLDMESPGVEVRPLYQITGEAEFNEVFLTDVRIPADRIFAREGEGWKVAITTLMNERSAIGGGASRKGGGSIGILLDLWKSRTAERLSADAETILRDRIARLYIESELHRLTSQRARAAQKVGNPGPEGSIGKLAQAELNKRIWECGMDVIGTDSLIYDPGYERRRPAGEGRSTRLAIAKYQFLRSRANSIEGGTSEVMRNILGERVLGLPGEPRVDKDVPWKDVPRSA